jgi:mannose-6-phosphate isomerase-like protein (cupin superfamily)
MAKYRIKLNKAHPTGSMNMRDANDNVITVSNSAWTPVEEISPAMRERAKWLVVEEGDVDLKRETAEIDISQDSTVVVLKKVPKANTAPEPVHKKKHPKG